MIAEVGTGSDWFADHYKQAPGEVVDFLAGDGVTLKGKVVADVGCGDGIIDLGIVHAAKPKQLIGFDIVPTDVEELARIARAEGACESLPGELQFRTCTDAFLPVEDATFDVVVSWSAFEHISRPIAVLEEIRRVLKPTGTLMIQLWPFYFSEHGSHLWEWLDEGFAHLSRDEDELAEVVRNHERYDRKYSEYQLNAYLNRITVDDLQRAIQTVGLVINKVELLTHAFHMPPQVAHLPISMLGISGIKLLASHSHG